MQTKVLQPQEIEVYYIIPTLRRYFAQALKHHGTKQKDIAKLLGVEESTISQYFTTHRAHRITFTPDVQEKIKQSTTRMNTQLDTIRETQTLLKYICASGELCRIHKQLADIPQTCNIQTMGCHT